MAGNPIAAELLDHLARAGHGRRGEPLAPESPLLDGTVDSLALIELISFVETRFGIPVPVGDVVPENFGTVADLSRYIAAGRRGSPETGASGPVAAR